MQRIMWAFRALLMISFYKQLKGLTVALKFVIFNSSQIFANFSEKIYVIVVCKLET